jgi:hypothetical protein
LRQPAVTCRGCRGLTRKARRGHRHSARDRRSDHVQQARHRTVLLSR